MNHKSTKELFSTFLSEQKAEALFTNFHGLRNIARASQEEFLAAGLDKKDIKQVRAVLELGRKYATQACKRQVLLDKFRQITLDIFLPFLSKDCSTVL